MTEFTRKKKLYYSTITSLLLQIFRLAINFILPRLFLENYGSEVNGLVASISQFLNVISLMELGVGAVIESAFYAPIANNDTIKISQIVKSANIFFRKISLIFIFYIGGLCFIFPNIISTNFTNLYSISLIIIIAISLIADYFLGITYKILLTAAQRNYIPNLIQLISIIANGVACIILIKKGYSIQIVKLVTALIFLIRPIVLNIIVNKEYKINKKVQYEKEPIPQKWNGLAQHIAYFVLQSTDIMVLTIFSSLKIVSVYSIYYLVENGIRSFVFATFSGVRSLFGDMYAKKEEKLKFVFLQVEWLTHNIVVLLFSCTSLLIIPFISIYTKGIFDANYFQPVFGILISIAFAMECIRQPYILLVLSLGHFKQTQFSAIVEMFINIVISILLVNKYGLIGVAIGTSLALFYRTCYLTKYISINVINYSQLNMYKHLIIDFLMWLLIFIIGKKFNLQVVNYQQWSILSIKILFLGISVLLLFNFIFYKKELKLFINKFLQKVKK